MWPKTIKFGTYVLLHPLGDGPCLEERDRGARMVNHKPGYKGIVLGREHLSISMAANRALGSCTYSMITFCRQVFLVVVKV